MRIQQQKNGEFFLIIFFILNYNFNRINIFAKKIFKKNFFVDLTIKLVKKKKKKERKRKKKRYVIELHYW